MAACLLVVIGAGCVSALAGLSMALGAFIAGLLLAETEFRHEVEVTIEPFKGLLLGLFFVSIGAGLDLSLVVSAPLATLGVAAGLIAVKFVVTYCAGRALRLPNMVAAKSALVLGPGGEFAFVMITPRSGEAARRAGWKHDGGGDAVDVLHSPARRSGGQGRTACRATGSRPGSGACSGR